MLDHNSKMFCALFPTSLRRLCVFCGKILAPTYLDCIFRSQIPLSQAKERSRDPQGSTHAFSLFPSLLSPSLLSGGKKKQEKMKEKEAKENKEEEEDKEIMMAVSAELSISTCFDRSFCKTQRLIFGNINHQSELQKRQSLVGYCYTFHHPHIIFVT